MTDMKNVTGTVRNIRTALQSLPVSWDGKEAVLKLKEMNYQWRQMEWIGWYFEVLCKERLKQISFNVPGKKYGNVEFDSHRKINWDIKASAIKSHSHKAILNDMAAIDRSIREHGAHGIILGLVDVEYNDEQRTFQQWHTKLKGGLSNYEKDRIKRNAVSRYRKRKADLNQILILAISAANVRKLEIYSQGRNSDGSPRNPKYMLDIENAHEFELGRVDF